MTSPTFLLSLAPSDLMLGEMSRMRDEPDLKLGEMSRMRNESDFSIVSGSKRLNARADVEIA